jgi:hypothetical protein
MILRRVANLPGAHRPRRETPRDPNRHAHPGKCQGSNPAAQFTVNLPPFSAFGAPQNDLTEYFSLLDFANPNYLGTRNEFRKNFENIIIRGRDAEASDKAKEDCEKKLKELSGLVTKFIIRRTNDLLSKYRQYSPRSLAMNRVEIRASQFPSSTSKSSSASRRRSSWSSIASSSPRPRSRRSSAARSRSR